MEITTFAPGDIDAGLADRGARPSDTPIADGAPVVRVRGLTKRFGTRRVWEGLDLDVRRGESLAIIGANGTGKSTLLRALVRLTEADDGRIEMLDHSVRDLDRRELRRLRARIGFVFQRHNLVGRLSALTNVVHGVQSRASGPRTWLQSLAHREVRAEALACLEAVGLADRAPQKAQSLSGGQSQRVAVARMLMQRPELIIADEPDASLDPVAGAEVMRLLFRIGRERDATLIFVSHHMDHALRFSDRIVGLRDGRVALDVASARIDATELRAFFGPDRTDGGETTP
ncbi:MAG: ATP-binding cassette domain-containing protein [Siculibacillus sp.]|nr:ATP-binding cassette domain-containing protein [Siculibacillus sp.]